MGEAQTPVVPVPPASRLGEIVGWSMLALAVACSIAFIVAAKQADGWSQAMRQAHAAFIDAHYAHPDREAAAYAAAWAAQRKATLLKYLLVSATPIFLLLIPGLLYATKPSLLGGPLGRLLRPPSARLAQRIPPRRHPVTFYQGIGMVLSSLPWINLSLSQVVVALATMPFGLALGLSLLPVLLFFTFVLVGYPLLSQATWWFLSSRGAERGREQPQAGGGVVE